MKTITVCLGCCCPKKGGSDLYRILRLAAVSNPAIAVNHSPCVGPCSEGPNIVVNGKLRSRVTTLDVENLLADE